MRRDVIIFAFLVGFFTSFAEKIPILGSPHPKFFCQKWENVAKKWHFSETFWPTLEIFTNLL
jgi:hypothetical protein